MAFSGINGIEKNKCHIPTPKSLTKLLLLNKREFSLILLNPINWIIKALSKSKPIQSYR